MLLTDITIPMVVAVALASLIGLVVRYYDVPVQKIKADGVLSFGKNYVGSLIAAFIGMLVLQSAGTDVIEIGGFFGLIAASAGGMSFARAFFENAKKLFGTQIEEVKE